MHTLFKGQVFCGGQGHTGGGDALYGRVVGQIGEQHGAVDGAGALEVGDKELGLLKGDADGGEHHGKVGLAVQNLCLAGDLSGQLGVRQAGAGKNGQLLAADQGVQTVDGGDTGLDKLIGIVTGGGVDGLAIDVQALFRQDGRAAVDGLAHAVEHAAQHIAGHAQLQGMAQKADAGLLQVDAGGAFKQLDHGLVAVDLQHLAAPDGAVGQLDLCKLVVRDAADLFHDHQRAGNFVDGFVFFHRTSPAFSAMAVICAVISPAMAAYSASYRSASTYFARPMRSLAGISSRSCRSAPLMAASRHWRS